MSELTPSNTAEHKILVLTDAARQLAQSLEEHLHALDGAPDAAAKALLIDGLERLTKITGLASREVSNDVGEAVRNFSAETIAELHEWLLATWANLFSARVDQIATRATTDEADDDRLPASLRQLENTAAMLRQCNRFDDTLSAKLERAREAVAKASSKSL